MATDAQLAAVMRDFARTMATDYPIQAVLDRFVERIADIMPVTEAGLTLISAGANPPYYIAASGPRALRFETLQTTLAEGPCLAAFRTGTPIAVPDLATERTFTRFSPEALDAGLAAVFAFPLRHGDLDALGALDLYCTTPGPLTPSAADAAQILADVAAAYILNAQRRQDLIDVVDRFQESSLHDHRTGLPNRVLIGQLIEHAVARSRRSGQRIAVLFVDLDRFTAVNDLYGHQVGDELLVAVAERLTHLLRPSDTLARLSGDEFVVLCEEINPDGQVEQLARRIDVGLNRPFALSNRNLHVTASIGIAYAGTGEDVPGRLLRDADTAMHQAKRHGGAGHQILDLRELEETNERSTLTGDLHGVLARDELQSRYQPVVATGNGEVIGVEALVRWVHPVRGVVSPIVMIPLAEQSRLICDIGRWMLTQACAARHRWEQANRSVRGIGVAVNVAAFELLSCDYVPMVESVLHSTGTDPSWITLEITESVLIEDPARARVVLQDLKDLGVRLALDDFGTGYSSLVYLHHFPVDIVKIDRSFVAKLDEDRVSEAIVTAIVDLAHALGKTVIAEGVETPAQFRRVVEAGCEACQGFYFAEPLSEAAVDQLLDGLPTNGGIRFPLPVGSVVR